MVILYTYTRNDSKEYAYFIF